MKSKRNRIIAISISVVVLIAILVFGGIQLFFRLPQPSYSGTEQVQGLRARVEVRTDQHGVPHIFAQNEADLFFAQGYITARERMFQMGSGMMAAFPATMSTAMVSPTARPIPRMIAAAMPESAAGTRTLLTVCQRVAPMARDPSLNS